MEGGQGGRWGFFGFLKKPRTGLIWLVTRVGGWGEAWGGGPWRAGKGGDGGGTSVGATKGALGSLKNLTTGLICGGMGGGVGRWPMEGGQGGR